MDFSTLKTAVAARLLDVNGTAVTAAQIGDTINASIRFWKQKHFYFNELSETKALTVGNPLIPVPTVTPMFRPFKKGGLIIRYQSQPREVVPVRAQQYDNANDEQLGLPDMRMFKGGNYYAFPYPDMAYNATWYGVKEYPDLAADGDNNDFTNYADRLILYDVLARINLEFRKDTEQATLFSQATDTEFKNLKSTTEEITGTGVLAVETIL